MSTNLAERTTPDRDTLLAAGTHVEVRSRFDASWSPGFEVIDRADDGYRIRRLSDGSELPTRFEADDLRPAKRRNNMWWY